MRQRRIYCGTELCENRNETHAIAEDDNFVTMPVIELLFPCSVYIIYPPTYPTSLSKFYIGTRQYNIFNKYQRTQHFIIRRKVTISLIVSFRWIYYLYALTELYSFSNFITQNFFNVHSSYFFFQGITCNFY